MVGFRPTQVVVGIAGELVKGFTTTLTQERKKPDRPTTNRSCRSSSTESSARPSARPSGRSPGNGTAPRRRPPRPRGGRGRVDRRLWPRQPSRLPGPPREDRHLQRLRPWCTSAPSSRSPRSSTSSCSRSSPSRMPWPASWVLSRSARPGPCSSTSAGHDRRGPRAPGRHRGHAHVRTGRTRLHQVDRRPARPHSRGRRSSRSTTHEVCRSTSATR